MSSDDPNQFLFVGTHGHVLALDKQSGRKIWDRSLPRTGYSVVSIVYEDGMLFCASGGRAFGLDPTTGVIQWQNDLPGMGSGMVFLSTIQSNNTESVMAAFQAEADAQRQAASGGAAAT